MDRLHFTQNDIIDLETCSITAASELRESLNTLMVKYLYFHYWENGDYFGIKYPNLSAFNDLRDMLEIFVAKYPLTVVTHR